MDLVPGAQPVSLQRRVQFVTLLQMVDHGTPNLATTVAICPGADRRDFEAALACLLDEASIEGPCPGLSSLVALAEAGSMRLTALGTQRLAEDDV